MPDGARAWGRVRSELRRPVYTGRPGRQVALTIVDAIRRSTRASERLYHLGPWRGLFKLLGLAEPCDKAARAALRLLASLTPHVRRVGLHARQGRGQTWIVASDDRDLPELGHFEERPAIVCAPRSEGKRNVTRSPTARTGSRAAATGAPRAPRRSPDLERLRRWGRRPSNPMARQLTAEVERLAAVEQGQLVTITITAPDGEDIVGRAVALARFFGGPGGGSILVPELSPKGRLHYHGFVVGKVEAVQIAWRRCGGGQAKIEAVRPGDYHRVRYWAGYCMKGPMGGHAVIATGVLAMPFGAEVPMRAPAVAEAQRDGDEPPTEEHGAEALRAGKVPAEEHGVEPRDGAAVPRAAQDEPPEASAGVRVPMDSQPRDGLVAYVGATIAGALGLLRSWWGRVSARRWRTLGMGRGSPTRARSP